MKDALLAEWTSLLDRITARFSRTDLDEINQQIRAVLIELARSGTANWPHLREPQGRQ
jgi:hypothetical protein